MNKISNKRTIRKITKRIDRKKSIKNIKKGGDNSIYIFLSDNITTQPNNDNSYREIGVVHITDSAAVNALRSDVTNFANFFGAKGFDNTIVDGLRNNTLNSLRGLIGQNQKVCNLRMEIEHSNPVLIFHHAYGTLLEKVGNVNQQILPPQPQQPI